MRKPRVALGLLLAVATFHDAAGYAQAPPAGPTFDVVSIKPSHRRLDRRFASTS